MHDAENDAVPSIDALRERYQAERDKRIRPDGMAQWR